MNIELVLDADIAFETKTIVENNISQLENIEFENYSGMVRITLNTTIIIQRDKEIHNLNKRFRNKNYSTDVITFNYYSNKNFNYEHNAPKTNEEANNETDIEVYISLETAQQQAQAHKITIGEELTLLSIHGILHGTGLDHETSPQEAKQMRSIELSTLDRLGLSHITPLIQA